MVFAQEIDQRVAGDRPANVMKYIKGIHFPAQKAELLAKAKENGAPEEVLQVLEQIPEQEFGGPQDILKGFGEVK